MPRRSMKQIREETFAELRENGRLEMPVYKPRVVPVKKMVDKPKVCCIDKYGDDLPQWFRPCADCFRTQERT